VTIRILSAKDDIAAVSIHQMDLLAFVIGEEYMSIGKR
jgi:hypothetical protein